MGVKELSGSVRGVTKKNNSNGSQFFWNGWLQPFERLLIVFERIAQAVRTAPNCF